MATSNDGEADEAIYGNQETIMFHYLTTTGGLIRDKHEPEEDYDEESNDYEEELEEEDYDDFTSDEEMIENTDQQSIQKEKENVQQCEAENIQDNSHNVEDDYLIVLSPSQSSQSRTPYGCSPCSSQPFMNKSTQHHQSCEVPRKEMISAMNSVVRNPQGWNPRPPLVNHIKNPMLPPVQKGFRNQVSPQTSHSSQQEPSFRQDDHSLASKLSQKNPAETGGSTVKVDSALHQQISYPDSYVSRMLTKFTTQSCEVDNLAAPSRSFPTSCTAFPQEREEKPKFPSGSTVPNSPFVRLENGVRITLTPLYQTILEKHYFHLISRKLATNLVMKEGDGAFVVRPSTKSDQPLTLTARHGGRVHHVIIRQRADNLFALGSWRDHEKVFSSIDEVISFYRREPIKLSNGAGLLLTHSPLKTGNVYVQHTVHDRRRN